MEAVSPPKRGTKYVVIDVRKTMGVIKTIQSNAKEDRKLNMYLLKFVEEIGSLSIEHKNLTQERCAKIVSSIQNFYYSHGLMIEDEVQEFITTLLANLKHTASNYASSLDKINALLVKKPYRDFKEARLYFVDAQIVSAIQDIKKDLEKSFRNPTEEKRFSFSTLVNMLNFDTVAHSYTVEYIERYKHVSDTKKIAEYLPAEFEIFKNKRNKDLEEEIKIHQYDTGTAQRLRKKLALELKEKQEQHEYLMSHLDEFEIKIISYDRAKSYPLIKYNTEEGYARKHLKKSTLNILWFKPKPFRSDMTIKDYLEAATHAYGDVYYLELKP